MARCNKLFHQGHRAFVFVVLSCKTSHTLLRWFVIDTTDDFSQHFAPCLEDKNPELAMVETFRLYKTGKLGFTSNFSQEMNSEVKRCVSLLKNISESDRLDFQLWTLSNKHRTNQISGTDLIVYTNLKN